MSSLYSLNKYYFRYKYRFLLGVFFVVGGNIFALVMPNLVGRLFDDISDVISGNLSKSEIIDSLIYLGLMVIAATFLRSFFLFMMRQTIIVMSRMIEYDIKNDIYSHYQKLSLNFYKQNRTGDLMNRITEDLSHVRMYLGPACMYSINLLTLILITISNMFRIDVILTLWSIIPLPFLSFIIYKVSDKINSKSEDIQKQLSSVFTFSQEIFSGIREIKSYAVEENTQRQFQKITKEGKVKNLSLVKIQALFFPSMVLLVGISNLLVVYVGGQRVMQGYITTGVIAEFIIYINILTWPIASVGWVASIIQKAEASQDRINEFLFQKPEIVNNTKERTKISGNITFDKVNLVYENTGIHALKDISFNIKGGEMLGVIGKTGSGRSTIVELITRLYETTSGRVYIDDTDISKINLDDLRQSIGYVPQESFLFSDTISENIRFGNKDVSQEEIEDISKKVSLHNDVMSFPDKYNTMIGERGITLSGGQKQRISIARAIIKNPKILILDDCFSAIDTKTEEDILSYLSFFFKSRTSIMITNRVSSIKKADQILVLANGEVLARGTHTELLENDLYRKFL
ncbi:ABC transporter ATP-binding protein [Ichthyobacterium seriolicida]|uniref:Multidrug ABC transporter n=1 Tax=Ichthyobacterium seriolicida TaxID=242600 RepID=A0A1J1DZX1_9FLAO|nr:ABC transporter ATP-binding protein [Ichthyobacterium seriolicida]BAV95457.1 multidrug ABC transporter [Ichthyobacterium seriolicida]